jgi:hypothetical protein
MVYVLQIIVLTSDVSHNQDLHDFFVEE